jgi:hypothetical protein
MSWITQYIEENKNEKVYLLNIYLVFRGGRDVTLIEDGKNLVVINFINMLLSLNMTMLYIYEYESDTTLISRFPLLNAEELILDEYQLGRLLGFVCSGHGFQDITQPRVIMEIKESDDSQIYVEVCNVRRIDMAQIENALSVALNRAQRWNLITEYDGLPYRFIASYHTDDGTVNRNNNINDLSYVEAHLDEYRNDLDQLYFPESILVEDPFSNLSLFKYIYNLIHLGNVWNRSVDDFESKIYEMEDDLLESDPSEYSKIINEYGLLNTNV